MDDALGVLVVDDHPMFRFGLCAALGQEPDIQVLAEASTGQEALRLATDVQPAVVVMDLQLPDMTGIEVTQRMLARSPGISVLILTMTNDDNTVISALRGGAHGYLLKDAGPDEIIRGIHAVAQREAIFGPDIATRVLAYFEGGSPSPAPFPDLTHREREVLALIAAGHGNATIARRLSLSPKTVRNHISNLFGKLGVASRAEAIVRAREAGLGLTEQASAAAPHRA